MFDILKCLGLLLLLVVLETKGLTKNDFIDDSQYHRMPKLSEVDDYDECMENKLPGDVSVFCMVRAVIRPDNSSDLWALIENFSKDFKLHENHALLERGICMKKCETLVQSLSNATKQALRVEKFPISFGYMLNVTKLKGLSEFKKTYGELADICINYDLNARYGLKGYTEIESCERSDEQLEVDTLDRICLVLLTMLVSTVIASSWYDRSLNKTRTIEHYKTDLENHKSKLLVTFSLMRNWYRLTYRSQSERSKELRIIQGFRFWTLFGVMWGHVYASYFYLAIQNGLSVEKQGHQLITILEFEGTRIVQTFFIFAAFLMAVTMLENGEKIAKSSSLEVLLKGISYRYIRLTPAHAFMILMTATWYPKLQNGPWWKMRADIDRSLCRQNWWTNLLYINNFTIRLCMDQTWYLSCDFQLFILGMIFLIAVIRLRKYTKLIIFLATGISIIWPAITVYFNKQEGTYIDAVQYRRFFYAYDDTFTQIYSSPQVNLINYLIGIVTGMIYLDLRAKKFSLKQKKWSCIAWFLLIPIGIGSLLVNAIFYWNDFPTPSLWMSLYFPLSKCSWGIIHSIGMLGLIFGAVPFLSKILNHRIFESLGRLTYSAYLCHLAVLRLILHNTRTPIHVSTTNMVTHTLSTATLSYLAALVLYLLIEQPTVAILYVMFGKSNDPKEQKQNCTKTDKCYTESNRMMYTTVYENSCPKDMNQNLDHS